MASVIDLSGNTPESDRDQAGQGHYDLQAVTFIGTQHTITISGTSQQTPIFSRQCRSIRIAPLGDIHWEIGGNPTATATSPHLPADAVEIVPVRFNDRVATIEGDTNTDTITITEDRS